MTTEELIAEAQKHRESRTCHDETYCAWCDDEWPCLTALLRDALAELAD